MLKLCRDVAICCGTRAAEGQLYLAIVVDLYLRGVGAQIRKWPTSAVSVDLKRLFGRSVIWLSPLQANLASTFCPDRVRARRGRPMFSL